MTKMRLPGRPTWLLLAVCCSFVAAAGGASGAEKKARTGDAAREDAVLATNLKRVESFQKALDEMAQEMKRFQETFTLVEKKHYTNKEHDLIEQLLFRYLMLRRSMWEIIEYHEGYRERFTGDERQARAFLIGYLGATQLYHYSARVVLTFYDEAPVRAKLNEAYYRSEIPAGTYDTLFDGVTNVDHLQRMAAAKSIFAVEIERSGTALNKLWRDDPRFKKVITRIVKFNAENERMRETILDKSSLLLPEVRNTLRHQAVTKYAQEKTREFGGAMYAVRGLTFKNVARLKNPMRPPLVFSADEVERMQKLLRPGDVILTFSQGYMSNIFLPGVFKHSITYVGLPAARRTVGLTTPKDLPFAHQTQRFEEHLKQEATLEGHPADLIEGVAEGVVFSSLEHLASYHFNRVVVFRPKLKPAQRVQQLTTVFRYLGAGYDFKFDFADATHLACTELVYHSLNGIGGIQFEFVPRMGRQTLSADDICEYAMGDGQKALEFVFLVVPDETRKGDHPQLLTGAEGLGELKKLFAEVAKE